MNGFDMGAEIAAATSAYQHDMAERGVWIERGPGSAPERIL